MRYQEQVPHRALCQQDCPVWDLGVSNVGGYLLIMGTQVAFNVPGDDLAFVASGWCEGDNFSRVYINRNGARLTKAYDNSTIS